MQSAFLKIISLNIELDRHLDRIIPFLKEEKPDVILLQEVFDKNIVDFEKATGKKSIFAVQNILYSDTTESQFGLLTLSSLPILKHYSIYYRGDENQPLRMHRGEPEKTARAILVTEVIKENRHYCLVNTHFTWAPNSKPNAAQHQDLNYLLQHLSKIPEFILCGDFNAPRGTIIFDTIASKYKDNIPSEVVTTIDKNLHKAGNLSIVVDGIFTTPKYQVDSIKIANNLSDHCAIIAIISFSELINSINVNRKYETDY
jgi:endonuclease/exonuclease/phosphatase family metal-dependent hydrolase